MLEENQQMQDYLHWTKYQGTIENLLGSEKELQASLNNKSELSQIPALLSNIARYNEAVAKVKVNVSGLSFQIQSTYERAASCLSGINATVAERFNAQKIVQTLDSLVQSYAVQKGHTTADNIYTIAAVYEKRLNLDMYLHPLGAPSKPDLFYLQLASLFPMKEAKEKYLDHYLHAANEQELISVRDKIITLQQQWLDKIESIELFAGDNKNTSLRKARICFLQESGGTWDKELQSEIEQVLKNPSSFFSFRGAVQKEQSYLQEEIKVLRSGKMIMADTWEKLVQESSKALSFPIPNTIYGREFHTDYIQTKEIYQKEIATQRKRALREAVARARDMPAEILAYEGHSYASFLEEKQKEVSQFKQRMVVLYPAISRNLFQEMDALLVRPPPGPINSKAELWDFAYMYSTQVQDESLAGICEQVAGFKKGKCITMRPLAQRLSEAAQMCTTHITPESLNAEDKHIYHRLYTAIQKYTN